MAPPKSMGPADVARIQSTQDKGGKDMSSNGFAARAQSAAATNANNNANSGGGNSGNKNNGGNQK